MLVKQDKKKDNVFTIELTLDEIKELKHLTTKSRGLIEKEMLHLLENYLEE